LVTILAVAAFLPFLGRRDIVISHEARVAQTARVMAVSGWPWNAKPVRVPAVHLVERADLDGALRLDADTSAPARQVNPWLVPVLNGAIRLQKPPLPYWCSAILFRIFGVEWSEALARLIPALLGALGTFLVADLARLVLGRRFALPAALVWVTSYFIPDEFRKVMADPYLAFFSLLAIWGWVRGSAGGSRFSVVIFYVATALGLLAKGPVLLVHLVIAIGLFHFLNRRKLPGGMGAHLLGIALLAAITLPWPVYIFRQIPDAGEIWQFESLGEMSDNLRNAKPFYYYIPLLFQISLPWTPLWIIALVLPFLRRRRSGAAGSAKEVEVISAAGGPLPYARVKVAAGRRTSRYTLRRLFPLLWFVLTVIFFSSVHMKKAAYLLPVMPAQTLMIAQVIVFFIADLRRKRRLSRGNANEILIFSCTLIVIALIAFFTFARTPIENARSPRLACNFIRMALAADAHCTVIPSRLPPEATLYLPVGIGFDRSADTLLYLVDDPKRAAAVDLQSFQQRLTDLNIRAVTPVTIPYAGRAYRYRLFRLTLGVGARKTFADARSTIEGNERDTHP
jgi:4-amino-4-deoxy-L-arabinose transferase-like glycosyltransferase